MVLDCTDINCNLVSSDRELALIEDFAPVVVTGKLLKCVITINVSKSTFGTKHRVLLHTHCVFCYNVCAVNVCVLT